MQQLRGDALTLSVRVNGDGIDRCGVAINFDVKNTHDPLVVFRNQFDMIVREGGLANLDIVVVFGVEEAQQSAHQPASFVTGAVLANTQHGVPAIDIIGAQLREQASTSVQLSMRDSFGVLSGLLSLQGGRQSLPATV